MNDDSLIVLIHSSSSPIIKLIWIEEINKASTLIQNNIDLFPLTKLIWDQSQMKINDERVNITLLCGNNPYCIEVAGVNNENNYCYNGISLGIQTILQKYAQFIIEVGEIPYEEATYEFLYKYITENKISRIETEVEFVIQNIQNNLYSSFYQDSEDLRQRIERNLNLVNSITIISGIGLIVVSLFVILIEIQRLYTVVLFGTHKTQILIHNVNEQ